MDRLAASGTGLLESKGRGAPTVLGPSRRKNGQRWQKGRGKPGEQRFKLGGPVSWRPPTELSESGDRLFRLPPVTFISCERRSDPMAHEPTKLRCACR